MVQRTGRGSAVPAARVGRDEPSQSADKVYLKRLEKNVKLVLGWHSIKHDNYVITVGRRPPDNMPYLHVKCSSFWGGRDGANLRKFSEALHKINSGRRNWERETVKYGSYLEFNHRSLEAMLGGPLLSKADAESRTVGTTNPPGYVNQSLFSAGAIQQELHQHQGPQQPQMDYPVETPYMGAAAPDDTDDDEVP